MKKTNKLLFMFVGALITMICGVQNVFASTLTYDFSGYYYERSDNGSNYSSWRLENYYVDGNVAFCIEPGIPEGNPMQQGTWEDTGLSNSIKERILLITYYGYQYSGHQTQNYRAATQALVWETILGGNTRVTYSTERYGGGTAYNVDAEKNVINNLVAQHYTKPSFNGTTVTAQVGTSVTLTDTNNVLSNYEVYASNNANVSINGNELTITPTEIGEVTLTFVKKQIYSRSYLIYYGDGIQNMISGGNVDPVYFSVKLKALGGKVEAQKYDSKTLKVTPRGEANWKGTTYGIYDMSDNLIQTLKFNDQGYALSDYLPYFGRYYAKELSSGEGYLVSDEKIYFEVTKEQMQPYIKCIEDVIEREYDFFKIYSSDETGIMTPEVGSQFEIYDINNVLVDSVISGKDGGFTTILPYGKYTLKQITTSSGHELMEDYQFEIKEIGDPINVIFGNAEIKANLKVIKIDEDTGKVIERANIKFKIKDVSTGEYVKQTITYPTAKTLEVFETDSNGVLITPYPLSTGTYVLEEVDQKIDGYLWNRESVEFTIDENSNLIYDNEFGILFEVQFANKQVMGEVELNKLGEKFVVEDGTYHYEEIKLDGVTYNLYAGEDIYSADGTLVYKENGLVGNYEIVDGYLKVNNLYLGKYYFLEESTLESHVLDTEKHYFTLEYKDQYTPIVSVELTFKNYMKKATLHFSKQDLSTSEPLPNTLIELYIADTDELIFSGRTDSNGEIIITDLPVEIKNFYLLEKEAPEGYKLNEEKMYFEITEDGQVVKCTMTDEAYEVPNTGLSSINYELIGSIVLVVSGLGLILYGIKKRK